MLWVHQKGLHGRSYCLFHFIGCKIWVVVPYMRARFIKQYNILFPIYSDYTSCNCWSSEIYILLFYAKLNGVTSQFGVLDLRTLNITTYQTLQYSAEVLIPNNNPNISVNADNLQVSNQFVRLWIGVGLSSLFIADGHCPLEHKLQ
jgi:hypothetical protein